MAVNAMPRIYGTLGKDVRYIDQDEVHHRSKFSVIDENHNGSSKLGVKGDFEEGDITVDYKFEMGIGTSSLYIRHAYFYLGNNDYGKLMVGQDLTAISSLIMYFDPLLDTGVGLISALQNSNIANADMPLGFIYRGRKNLIGYKSPNMGGLEFIFTRDDNQTGGTLDRKRGFDSTNNTTYSDPIHNEFVLTYKKEFQSSSFNLIASYGIGEGHETVKNYDTAYSVGGKVEVGPFAFTVNYALTTIEKMQTTIKKENETSYTSATGSYKYDDHQVALTYGTFSGEEYYSDSNKRTTDRLQFALGYKYYLSKNVIFSVGASQYTVEYSGDNISAETKKANENEATTFGTGVRINF
jgi:predicted porin